MKKRCRNSTIPGIPQAAYALAIASYPVTTSGHAEGYFEHGKGPMAQYKGTVKWFNNAKGYGFLGREDGPDVFVHYSSIKLEGYKTLKEGDEVEFDVIQGTKGPQADQVTRTKSV